MGNQTRLMILHSKTKHGHQRGNYVIFFTNQGPAITIAVPKGKSVKARFYKGNVLHKLKKYFLSRTWCPWHQVVARQCFVTQSGHCTQISQTGKGCRASAPSLFAPRDTRLKQHLDGRKYQTCKNLVSAIFQCLKSIPRKDMKMHFKTGLKD